MLNTTQQEDIIGEQVGLLNSPLKKKIFIILLMVTFLLPSFASANTPYLKDNADTFLAQIDDSYGQMINIAALLHDYDPKLITAVIVVESEGKNTAISNKGAKGLMQLMPATAKAMGATNPKDPFQNILAGTKYLKELESKYGFRNPQEALVAYNMGPSRAHRWLSQYDPDEYGYVQKVMYVYSVIVQIEKDNDRLANTVNTSSELAFREQDSLLPQMTSMMTRPRNISLLGLPLSLPSSRRSELVNED